MSNDKARVEDVQGEDDSSAVNAEGVPKEELAGTESEEESAAAVEEEAAPTVEELQLLLEDARTKADDHWNQVMRGRAEVDNLRKRQQRELENAHKYALDNFVSELLQVWDSLELGVTAAHGEGASVEKLREGSELTLKLLTDVMGKFGVEQVNPVGEPFNPDRHQAISTEPAEGQDPNTVVTVVQRGYVLNGRLVRPALVTVSPNGG
ncbi:MAG: nucleotide exchange factor GrpE [Pseudomonadota bacterium]